MNRQTAFKWVTGLLLSLAIAGITVNCGKKGEGTPERAMVVVFVSGDAKIVKAKGGDLPAKVGMIVSESDQIKTTAGSVDLQSRTGSAVRVREFTTITVAKLSGMDGGDTRLKMDHGSLLATVKKESAKETFNVVTPTAIAGVRGTTFSVDVQDGQRPRVKVLEGKVAMAPHIPALDNYTKEEIQSNESLKKLADLQDTHEIVLEDKTEGTLNPEMEKKVIEVNEALETAHAENKSVADVGKMKEVVAMSKEMDRVDLPAVATKEADITQQDLVDKQTLITVAPEVLDKVIESGTSEKAAKAPEEVQAVQELKKVRESQEDVVLKKIEEDASKIQLNSTKEIQKYYNKLELITLKSGEKISGAVIAQTGDMMVIHSPAGVRRVKKSDVESQEFLY